MSYEGDQPFRHWVIDRYCEPIPPDELPKSEWDGWEVHYDNDLERGKRTSRAIADLPDSIGEVFAELRDPLLIRGWAHRVGIDGLEDDPKMHGGGLHCMLPGGWLQTHVDYETHPVYQHMERRVNLIAFLHPEWRPEWGGQLLLTDPAGKPVVEIDPLPGRLVAFECGPASYHGVRRLSSAAPPRVSAAVYWLAPRRPTATRRRALFIPNRQAPECPVEVR